MREQKGRGLLSGPKQSCMQLAGSIGYLSCVRGAEESFLFSLLPRGSEGLQ